MEAAVRRQGCVFEIAGSFRQEVVMSPVRPVLALPDPALPLVTVGAPRPGPRRRSQLLPELARQSELDTGPVSRRGHGRGGLRRWIGGVPAFEMLALGGFLMLAASGAI